MNWSIEDARSSCTENGHNNTMHRNRYTVFVSLQSTSFATIRPIGPYIRRQPVVSHSHHHQQWRPCTRERTSLSSVASMHNSHTARYFTPHNEWRWPYFSAEVLNIQRYTPIGSFWPIAARVHRIVSRLQRCVTVALKRRRNAARLLSKCIHCSRCCMKTVVCFVPYSSANVDDVLLLYYKYVNGQNWTKTCYTRRHWHRKQSVLLY